MPDMTLTERACRILETTGATEKAALSRAAAVEFREDPAMEIGNAPPPDRPGRPGQPELLHPAKMPRRRGGTPTARAALLHAVLHIELNAIDLAWDMVARFTSHNLPRDFYEDWVKIGDEEAKHFTLLADRLADLGFAYGDFPAHDGLWEAAYETRNDLAARLAIVPMVLEARGLDVTPAMIERFAKIGDDKSAGVLKIILKEEIGHVATGGRWFRFICERNHLDARLTWQALVRKNFKGLLKPPFNEEARESAGLPPQFYQPLAAKPFQKQTKNGKF
ncbi:MAG: ferritin-like domain-containing protein [Alphaproteobacteria bacterium]|nr:MAG: ferritin-like domain-containing protein [Alphaproteobacteria bacterium]